MFLRVSPDTYRCQSTLCSAYINVVAGEITARKYSPRTLLSLSLTSFFAAVIIVRNIVYFNNRALHSGKHESEKLKGKI